MSGQDPPPNPYKKILEEICIAIAIVIGHGIISIVILAVGWVVHYALEYFTDPKHPFQLAGVTVRYILEGGELALVAVTMLMGVISAAVNFFVRIKDHVKD